MKLTAPQREILEFICSTNRGIGFCHPAHITHAPCRRLMKRGLIKIEGTRYVATEAGRAALRERE
ncbi:hypothetical protein HGK82_22380 [Ochrobactrum sp. MT180101]|nr:hypothetical protein [Ochrobactrum sp. UNC390CL2Tsu3S39]QOD65841.1 hypothetical protein HGK82_22380 [Ochrobactrum sp. MT180101]